jgi:hypothetical protein
MPKQRGSAYFDTSVSLLVGAANNIGSGGCSCAEFANFPVGNEIVTFPDLDRPEWHQHLPRAALGLRLHGLAQPEIATRDNDFDSTQGPLFQP